MCLYFMEKKVTDFLANPSIKPKTYSGINLLLMDTYCTLSSKLILIFDGWKKEKTPVI